MSTPRILGFSHVFGEVSSPSQAVLDYWRQSFELVFTLELGVGSEKSESLLAHAADHAKLWYFSLEQQGAPGLGFEFVSHEGERSPAKSLPRVNLHIQSAKQNVFQDSDGNACTLNPSYQKPLVVVWRTHDLKASESFLLNLGFETTSLSESDQKGFGLEMSAFSVLQFVPRLLKNLGVCVVLVHDDELKREAFVDDVGWGGLSFLVKDLDEIKKHIPVLGEQSFVHAGTKRRVAFFRGCGVLVEFLQVSKGA